MFDFVEGREVLQQGFVLNPCFVFQRHLLGPFVRFPLVGLLFSEGKTLAPVHGPQTQAGEYLGCDWPSLS